MNINKEHTTEQAILEAAEKLFLEKGFAMVTTTEIANVVGCNQALVHYYYRTKERLFEAIFEKKAKLLFSNLLQIGEENISFEERLTKKIESHFDMLKVNPKLPFLFFNELTTNPQRLTSLKEKMTEFPKSIFEQFQSELNDEISKGTIRPISVIDLMLSILSLNMFMFIARPIIAGMLDISDSDFNEMLEQRRKLNVDIILRSLRP